MKYFNILLILFLSIFTFQTSATIWTVSNYAPVPAQFTDIGSAQTAASNNDTIYVHGSPTMYAGVWISKKLTFIGPGYNPKTDFPHVAHANELSTTVGGNGSVIIGFRINSVSSPGGSGSDTIKNYTYSQCQIGNYGISKNYENLLVENCIFTSTGNALSVNWPNPYQVGLIVRNCIFSDTRVSVLAGSVVDHCVFIGSSTSQQAFLSCVNSTFSNNIFVARNISLSGDATNCIFNNNLTFNCSNNNLPLPGNTGVGNISNLDPLFVNHQVSPPTVFSFANNYRLQSSSPGYGAATDGTDLGVYGNNFPFTMTGEVPFTPIMRKLNIYNTTVPFNGTLDVQIKSSVPVRD
jgi:hypothetical protein